jgi:hypothetical protein
MDPPDFGWLWRDLKAAIEQPLIEAVTRPKHQLMLAWPHRIFVPVGRRMMDGKKRHDTHRQQVILEEPRIIGVRHGAPNMPFLVAV